MSVISQIGEVKGRLVILAKNVLTGKIEEIFRSPNLVVTQFKIQSLYLLAGNSYANRHINTIRLGTSNTAPTLDDTTITNPVGVSISSDAHEYTIPYANVKAIVFTAILGAAVGNGVGFVEAGLFHANGVLATRLVFPIMTKSSNFVWTLNWTLSITVGS